MLSLSKTHLPISLLESCIQGPVQFFEIGSPFSTSPTPHSQMLLNLSVGQIQGHRQIQQHPAKSFWFA